MVMFAMFISSVHYTRKAQLFPSDYLVSYTMFLELRYVGR